MTTSKKNPDVKKDIWTPTLKKLAAKQLLNIANHYEVKTRKSLRNIDFKKNGQAKWSGNAHDYTVNIESLKPQ